MTWIKHPNGEGPSEDASLNMAEERLWSEDEKDTGEEKKEKVLAFTVEERPTWLEVQAQHSEELNGRWGLGRPDLFGFAAGAIVDANTGEATRFGPDEAEQMLAALEEADVMVSWNDGAFELGVLGVPPASKLREKHLNLVMEYEFEEQLEEVHQDEITEGAALYGEGRIGELLDHCEAVARWTAEAYWAVRLLESGVAREWVKKGGKKVYLDLWNITLASQWNPKNPFG